MLSGIAHDAIQRDVYYLLVPHRDDITHAKLAERMRTHYYHFFNSLSQMYQMIAKVQR